MFTRTVSPEDLARLKAEREEADRRYNEALSAVDAAVVRPLPMPHAPPPPDETQVTPLNTLWRVVPEAPPAATGLRAKLTAFVWRLVTPMFERQQAFNSALVDHINRNVAVDRQTPVAIAATIDRLLADLMRLEAFQSALLVYLQQVTPYVDTKDREFAGLGRRIQEDAAELADLLDHRTVGLAGAISGVSDELLKRWESMQAREARFAADVQSLSGAHEALRSSLAVLQQASHTAKRELERLLREQATTGSGTSGATTLPVSAGPPAGVLHTPAGHASVASSPLLASTLDSFKYVGFEDQFRGSAEDIRARMSDYVPLFADASDVLDIGCGRGEFLDLLREKGITARGLDINHEMVEVCRTRGLEVAEGDAVSYLRSLPDASIGGLISAQVVEHLEPDYMLRLLDVAYHKLRPGSRIILETINPACWFAFFQSYIRDVTHVQPVHPETLSYFLTASGFQRVTVQYRAPYPEHEKLQPIRGHDAASETFNANVEKLNRLMFTYLDYAAIGERL